MILVDTSVWIEHLRRGEPTLTDHLLNAQVLIHPLVIGELAMGNLTQRTDTLRWLGDLPRSVVATDQEVMDLVTREALHGRGIGYLDAHLLASVRLTHDARLWTLDRRLSEVAMELGLTH